MRASTAKTDIRNRAGRGVLAVLLGAAAGIFVNGYWLAARLPATGSRILVWTAIAAAAAAVGYWLILPRIARGIAEQRGPKRLAVLLLGAVVGAFLLFAGTSAWQGRNLAISLLLPEHKFRLEAVGAREGTAVVWINTALGDTSYETVTMEGWRREGDALVLRSADGNSLEWSAVTGRQLTLVFQSAESDGSMGLEWDGHQETIALRDGRTTYERSFSLPFFASAEAVIVLGFVGFWLLSLWLLILASDISKARRDERERTPALGAGHDWRGELALVGLLVLLALALRALNLDAVFPAVDEYYHLIAADQLLQGAAPQSVYPRSLWTVTMPVALALGTLGHEVWAARLIGAVVNGLAVIPLWLLARKVNRPVAVLACLLYASSPWIITFGRVAREYAYYPFFFYWIALAMVTLIEAIPRDFIVLRDWKKFASTNVLLPAAILIVPPIFALSIDLLSTFRTILIAYLVLGVFLAARLAWRDTRNWPFIALLGLAVAAASYSWYQEQVTKLLPVPRLNPVPLQYFFPNPEQQWYFDRAGVIVALAFGIAVVGALRIWKRNAVPLFFISLFLSYLAVFTLFSKSFFHTRHLLSTQFWYVLVVAMGLWWLWAGLRTAVQRPGSVISVLLAAGIGLLTVNVGQVMLPSVSRDPDMSISEDYMHDMSAVHEYMLEHASPEDALVATVYGFYATWEGEPKFADQSRITSQTSLEELQQLVSQHATGWIVIDSIRLDISVVSARTITGMPQMEYIGLFEDEHVWRWGRSGSTSDATSLKTNPWTSH